MMRENAPLTRGMPLLKGFLGGSLFAGSLTVHLGIWLQALLFIIALAVVIDSCCAFGRERHILGHVSALAVGLFLGMVFFFWGQIAIYMLLTFFIMALAYFWQFLSGKK
jgi:hypothetical protein